MGQQGHIGDTPLAELNTECSIGGPTVSVAAIVTDAVVRRTCKCDQHTAVFVMVAFGLEKRGERLLGCTPRSFVAKISAAVQNRNVSSSLFAFHPATKTQKKKLE